MSTTESLPHFKFIFVAHPVSGNEEDNLKEIDRINLEIHRIPGHIPVFPSHTWRRYLNDGPKDRKLKELTNRAYFTHLVTEVWVYGPRISAGMKKEILLALWFQIPVVIKNPELQAEYDAILRIHEERRP